MRASWRAGAAGLGVLLAAACGEATERPAPKAEPARAGEAARQPSAANSPDAPVAGETARLPSAPADRAGAFRLAGNEPSWSVRIDARGLLYSTPDYPRGIRFAASAPESTTAGLRWVALTAAPEAHTIEVALEAKPCQDTMADKVWTHTAVIVFDGASRRGCGERLTP